MNNNNNNINNYNSILIPPPPNKSCSRQPLSHYTSLSLSLHLSLSLPFCTLYLPHPIPKPRSSQLRSHYERLTINPPSYLSIHPSTYPRIHLPIHASHPRIPIHPGDITPIPPTPSPQLPTPSPPPNPHPHPQTQIQIQTHACVSPIRKKNFIITKPHPHYYVYTTSVFNHPPLIPRILPCPYYQLKEATK